VNLCARKSHRQSLLAAIVLAAIACVANAAPTPGEPETGPSPIEQKLRAPVDVTFNNTPILDAVRILAEKGDLNIVANGDLKGSVTMRGAGVPLGEVLNSVLSVGGYTYRTNRMLLTVVPSSEPAQMPPPLNTQLYRISYADVDEAKKSVELALSSAGRVQANKSNGTLVVSDVATSFPAVERVVKEVDRRTPQVLIAAKIMDVALSNDTLLGINWQVFDHNSFDTNGDPRKLASSKTFDPVDLATTLRVGVLGSRVDMTSILQAMQKKGDARLLAHPQILSMDNEEASIEIIEQVPYQQLTQTQQGGQIGTTDFKEVGVKLIVTPRITDDNHVIMKINPSFSLLAGFTEHTDQPIIDIREAKTTMMVEDGATVVIGGLRRTSDAVTRHKVPVIGSVPLVGLMFRSRQTNKVDTELMVFVSPSIVRQPALSPREAAMFNHEPKPLDR